MKQEEWRVIPTYPDYAASSWGRIKRLTRGHSTRPNRILKPRLRNGYLSLRLTPPRKLFDVHRLIALTFIGQCPQSLQCNHRNGNKLDNRSENLEYISPSENCIHAYKMGLIKLPTLPLDHKVDHKGQRNPNARLTPEEVFVIRNTTRHIGFIQELAKRFTISPRTVHAIRSRSCWTHLP